MLSLVLLGAGCLSGDPFAQCLATTPWNSCINADGVDEALLGSWTLDSVLIAGQTHPFSGRETTFAINNLGESNYGAYGEDWTNELKERSLPEYPGVSTCEGIGYGGGSFKASFDTAQSEATLKVYPTGSNATLRCQANGIAIEVSGTTPPLGTGPVSTDADGLHMAYTYTISNDLSVLTISFNPSTDGVPISYTFRK